jgi:hypothetical protein
MGHFNEHGGVQPDPPREKTKTEQLEEINREREEQGLSPLHDYSWMGHNFPPSTYLGGED